MESPEHVDEQKPEAEQVLSPVEEKLVLPVGEKKRPWMEPLLRVVAIVVSLMSGIASVYLIVLSYRPWLELGFQNSSADQLAYLRTVALLLVFLVGLGGSMLFRSWWALLVVPLALSLGAVLTNYLSDQIAYDLLHYDDVGFGVIFDTATCILSAIVGALIGTLWKKRQQL